MVNVPLSCSENLAPLLQTRKPSRTSTGGFQSLAFRRFACIFFFATSYFSCKLTPSFAAHHKYSRQPGVCAVCVGGGTAVAGLTCISFLCENHKWLKRCRLTFVEVVFFLLICAVNLKPVILFSLWRHCGNQMSPLIKCRYFGLNHDPTGPNSFCVPGVVYV